LISRWSILMLLGSIALLVLVLFIGVRVNGATRWMGIGGERGFRFQPSELAKLAIILAFAQMSCKFGEKKMGTFKYGVLPFVIFTLITIVLLYLQPHLSGAIIIGVLAMIMMFAGGTRMRWFIMAGVVAVAAVVVVMYMSMVTVPVENDEVADGQITEITTWDFSRFGYAGRRINAWLDPEADPLQGGFQIRQSLNAIGSGGLLGQGLGQSRQKHLHLPEEHNDFIFAIVAEELGFVGTMLILMLFVLLIIRGYWLALNAKDRYSWLITIGITSLLAIQVFLNVAVVTNMLPATGISLPFFSYGGTALLVQMFQMGIVLAVSREIPTQAQYERRSQIEEELEFS
jgi:cell division protein FtsW